MHGNVLKENRKCLEAQEKAFSISQFSLLRQHEAVTTLLPKIFPVLRGGQGSEASVT